MLVEVSKMAQRDRKMNSLRGAKLTDCALVTSLPMFPSIFALQGRGMIQNQCLKSDRRWRHRWGTHTGKLYLC